MGRIFHPLLFLLARCSRNQLIRQIEFLKAENEILRSRVPKKQIRLKPHERERLLQLGEAIGPGVRHLITVVTYSAYRVWIRARGTYVPKPIGRPRTEESIRKLIVKIASETGWGYTRVMGELKKLQIVPPSRSTVKRILRQHKLEPGPKSGPGTWEEFLRIHAETLWQADFFSRLIWTRKGLRQCYLLVFLHVGSRRAFVTPCTLKPTSAWVKEQAEAFIQHTKDQQISTATVLHDRDANYRQVFDETLRAAGIEPLRNQFRSPNLQAYVERFIQSIQQECTDHFIVCGERHFDYLVKEYVEHYHTERPHQSKGNVPLSGPRPEPSDKPPDEIVCRKRLGGLLKHYERAA